MPTPAEDPEEVAQRGLRDDLRNAERKLQELVAKRDALNTESRLIRDERDMLNNQRSGLMEEMRTVKWDRDRIINEIPLKRVATAEDVADSIVFLAGEKSRHITGEVININGGSVLCG